MALRQERTSSSLFSADAAGAIRLMAYLALACALMVADHHFSVLHKIREASAVAVEPVFVVAALPARLVRSVSSSVADRHSLEKQNRRLRKALMLAEARNTRMHGLARQNRRYRQLLDVQEQLDFSVQTARLIGVDLGPYRHRILVGAGRQQNVQAGMTIMDAHGIVGQVVEVGRDTSQVMLITAPGSAVPVVDQRTGMRLVVRGTGQPDRLRVGAIPLSADVRAGDRLVTSGLGGGYPAGFPVAKVHAVHVNADSSFRVASLSPAAQLGTSSELLLLREQPEPVGPPAPALPYGPPADLAPGSSRPEAHSARASP